METTNLGVGSSILPECANSLIKRQIDLPAPLLVPSNSPSGLDLARASNDIPTEQTEA